MTQQAFERGDWQAVIEAHRLESHDPAKWLRYGAALLHTLEPGPQQGRQQQQAALAFVQAQKEGASAEAVMGAQQQAVLRNLIEALRHAELLHQPA
jgi:aryl-alcohol dehydrogenase-like predicted oxidoreductase